ncbi:sensor histidine kinase [Streptomyces sp. t39]|uniref:sensor histidine kinase n=1 Tax=Streptomyces sp. t39 TaxID=1828156 RepID=UPI003967AC2C
MSQLRAPAPRSDRREGGRHGRPGPRTLSSPGRSSHASPLPPEARIRPQLLRTAVLPTVVAALCGAAAVIFVLRAASPEPTFTLWVVLLGMAAIAITAVAAAALGAERTARTVLGRASALRRTAARGQAELRTVVDRLRRGEGPPPRRAPVAGPRGGDEFDLLTHELTRSHDAAVTAVVQASRLSSSVGNEQKVEVFVNLARRLQSLVHREIQLLDELENEVEDPELLKGLFHVDHLATRIRRHAENLAVLGGAVSRRQWSRPVTMTEVLRSAIAEVEQYPRVKLVPPIDGTLRGHAVADVIHLLAELVENATLFSAPHTQVLLRAQHVTAGLAVEVEDRGLGMPAGEQEKMNALLTDPDQVNVAHLLQDGRIGLFVVSALARRHGIAVRLQSNIYGGVQAVLEQMGDVDLVRVGEQGVHLLLLPGGHAEAAVLDLHRESRRDVLRAQQDTSSFPPRSRRPPGSSARSGSGLRSRRHRGHRRRRSPSSTASSSERSVGVSWVRGPRTTPASPRSPHRRTARRAAPGCRGAAARSTWSRSCARHPRRGRTRTPPCTTPA